MIIYIYIYIYVVFRADLAQNHVVLDPPSPTAVKEEVKREPAKVEKEKAIGSPSMSPNRRVRERRRRGRRKGGM